MGHKFGPSRSDVSATSDVLDPNNGKPPLPPQSRVTFARRTPSGRYINYSRDDLDSELSSSDYHNYTVHIPPTPDNQPNEAKVEEQYVSNSLFTGGFNSITRAHLMDKVIDSNENEPQGGGHEGASCCAVNGCDGKVMRDDSRNELSLPCDCDFKICRDCYIDVLKTGSGICPGCKDEYKTTDLNEAMESWRVVPQLEAGMSGEEKGLEMMRSTKSLLKRSQTGEFDHNRWLFETKGTYGYGNAIWQKEGHFTDLKDAHDMFEPAEMMNKPWRPLTRKLKIPAAIISPYRYFFFALFHRFLFMFNKYCVANTFMLQLHVQVKFIFKWY